MGKCVDQSLFYGKLEYTTGVKGLKIAISQQFSYVNFSICFVCFFIYYMCDGSIASNTSSIISLVTGKNEYKINATMKKASIIFKQKI